jgi:LacI family transcriptional regulator, repressor for deo operon, udp, cdd, tsx, nupC, and nupG
VGHAPRDRSGSRSAVTIYDVAEAAGVAASTVSRAFSRPGRVNARTAEHIHRVAAELGYRRNPLAAALPTGRTDTLALVVTDVTNPVYGPIIRGGGLAAREAGYTLLLADSQEDPELERAALDRALPVVDGFVMASSRLSDAALRTIATHRPMVVLNRGVAGVTSVHGDNDRGMRRVAEHLGELGHETLTYVAGPEASWADGMRWRALQEAALELELRVRRIGPQDPTVAGGEAACDALVEQDTTAVVAYNDLVAIGVMRGLAQRRITVPRDVSVVGYDNIFGADFGLPGLTTVAAPLLAMGRRGVERVLEMIRTGRVGEAEPVVLPVRLVVRGSTTVRRH